MQNKLELRHMLATIDPSPLLISLATTCVATAATFLLGLLAARFMYGVRGPARAWRAWIDGVLTLPLVLPPTVVGFFLLLLLGRRSPIGQVLEQVGVTIVFSWPATVIAATVVAFPLMYRTTLGAFEQVNPTLLDAARTLGASEGVVFRRVLLPMAGPGVLAGTVLAFARALGEFGATLMLAGNIPGRTETMPLAIFSAAEGGDMRVAYLWVALIVVISLAIIRLLNFRPGGGKRPRRGFPAAVEIRPTTATLPTSRTRDEQTGLRLEADVTKELDGFTLEIKLATGGGAVGLLGASGAGKSMTLRMIAGIVHPSRGRIQLNGRVLFDSTTGENLPAAQRRIGVVFQDYALFPRMTVAENVGFGLLRRPKQERLRLVQEQMERMHIGELADQLPSEISGGQRQRVAIARCMATEPDALLFDEPFAALDPHLRRQTEEQLRETLTGYDGAVLFVTHDMEEAFRFCSDLLVLDHGKVIASGPKHDLFERPGTVVAARLTGCKNIAEARRVNARLIAVEAWGCELETAVDAPAEMTHTGMRSHQIRLQGSGLQQSGKNSFPCWLMATSEAPHEMTLYLRLHNTPMVDEKPHLQADIPKEMWRALRDQAQPWRLSLDPARLLLLEGRK
jgi:molybdate transport system permease protein